jgi:hypothetical protein
MENSSGHKAQWKRTTEEQRKIMAGYEFGENFCVILGKLRTLEFCCCEEEVDEVRCRSSN